MLDRRGKYSGSDFIAAGFPQYIQVCALFPHLYCMRATIRDRFHDEDCELLTGDCVASGEVSTSVSLWRDVTQHGQEVFAVFISTIKTLSPSLLISARVQHFSQKIIKDNNQRHIGAHS